MREVTVVSKPHTDVRQYSTQSRVGRVYGADEVREPEVSWCEMPGAVNRADGCDEFVVEASILSEKESGSGH